MGFCTEKEYVEFMQSCPEFERMLVRSGIVLIKYWFSVSDEEQERRFHDRMDKPTKRWKLSPMDLESRKHWADYSRAKGGMAVTDTKQVPWYVVNAESKKSARVERDPAPALDDSLPRFDACAAEAAADHEVEVCEAADPGAELHSGGLWVRRQTADSRQQTADGRWQTADSRQKGGHRQLRSLHLCEGRADGLLLDGTNSLFEGTGAREVVRHMLASE